ncbi:MAG TPA: GntR family transcriptional regulator, partial [Dokdonella sp.]|nr:GntR family transcriptional regulator [Dokdonella sp.]
MYMELDGQGPRYAQLIRALKSAILEARLGPGSRVPASRSLANELGISRNTVLAAYDQLQAEGFLHGRVGSGSYVADIGNRSPAAARSGGDVPVAPLSAFARRALTVSDGALVPGRQHKDLRYNLQYGLPLTNPALASAWRREVNRA